METLPMTIDQLTLDLEQSITIDAPIAAVFQGVLHRLGAGNTRPDGEPMHLNIEPYPGGRWFRDRGNGIGHLWGHVQTIKAPHLLELTGPMFMSYPAINHVEVKLEETPAGVRVTLRHRALGMISEDHRKGVHNGWKHIMDTIAADHAPATQATSKA